MTLLCFEIFATHSKQARQLTCSYALSADLVPGSTRFRHRVYNDFSGEKVPLAEVDSDFSGEKVPLAEVNSDFSEEKVPIAEVDSDFSGEKVPHAEVNSDFHGTCCFHAMPGEEVFHGNSRW